ncbi:hypothetical protein HPB48_014618 [Haemaphysalis longicornis]|uniref:Uncharacterized protein n=1 Tax=Haemaphysalis longicornis TaxID=44386 RepID=A0A9J6FAW6_HAELO|nr:hypothetical protein HPB48_014618 [Haemaphysalis longicornis]
MTLHSTFVALTEEDENSRVTVAIDCSTGSRHKTENPKDKSQKQSNIKVPGTSEQINFSGFSKFIHTNLCFQHSKGLRKIKDGRKQRIAIGIVHPNILQRDFPRIKKKKMCLLTKCNRSLFLPTD